MSRTLNARELKDALEGSGEIALVDVRPEAIFGSNHILLASNVPIDLLELKFADLVPRRSTKIALCDGGEGYAERAAETLARAGYTDISLLEGGVNAWGGAGFELFSGLYVPSKAFGEYVEHHFGTPSVSAEDLHRMIEAGENIAILDSRPAAEYRAMNIPGAVDMPGAELVYRVQEAVADPETTIVVNCAGRTRSIIGAQSLINAGIPNKVFALRNGTMGWHLAGYELQRGNTSLPPEVSEAGAKLARNRSRAAAKRFGVRYISPATLKSWQEEGDRRNLFILDVRTAEEFAAGHVAGSRHAPGGQLVQATDSYIGVHRSRIVLVDPEGVRAEMTGSWLRQLGRDEVYVLEGNLGDLPLETGMPAATALGPIPDAPVISPDDAAAQIAKGALFLDLTRSLDFRERHPEGARWAKREGLQAKLARIGASDIVLTARDPRLARLAAAELVAAGVRASALDGGSAAWEQAGLAMEAGAGTPFTAPDDVYMRPYDKEAAHDELVVRMNAYLTWEVGLVAQIARPGGVIFPAYN